MQGKNGEGEKMSKSLGNSPDPLDLISKYGADAVRLGMLLCSSAGSDILYDESQIEQGRNFCGKIWNSFRLVRGWTVDESAAQPEAARCRMFRCHYRQKRSPFFLSEYFRVCIRGNH